MTVPFEHLGPHQVGRLAYQVIGKDGPIFNPRNIKYLPPDFDADASLGLDSSGIAAGLAGINLLVSAGTLVLSAATLASVRRIENEVAAIRAEIADLKSMVDKIARQVERIDIGVAELNLREAMRHVFRTTLTEDGIDLALLARIADDIDNFSESLPETRSPWALHFPTDLHDQLNSVFGILFSLRRLIATRHNQAVGGDPERVVSLTGSAEYLGNDPMELASIYVMSSTAVAIGTLGAAVIADDIAEQFSWANRDVEGSRYESLMKELMVEAPFSLMLWRPPEMEKDTCPSIENVAVESILKFKDVFRGLAAKHLIQHNLQLGAGVLKPNPTCKLHEYSKLHSDDIKFVHCIAEVQKVLEAWLWHSHEGLLARLRLELTGIERSYEKVFWPHLLQQDRLSGLGEIKFSGQLPEPT